MKLVYLLDLSLWGCERQTFLVENKFPTSLILFFRQDRSNGIWALAAS